MRLMSAMLPTLAKRSRPSLRFCPYVLNPDTFFQSPGQARTMFADTSCRSRLRTSKMRLITFIVAVIAASTPAGAQDWREYQYTNEGFTVAFPAEPKVENTSYQAS